MAKRRQDYSKLSKSEKLKLLQENPEVFIPMLNEMLSVSEKRANEIQSKVQRQEDKAALLLPLILLTPALAFSNFFPVIARSLFISLLPGFALACFFALRTLWPYTTPIVRDFFVPDPRDIKAVDLYYESSMFYQRERLRCNYAVLEPKAEGLKWTTALTTATFIYLFVIAFLSFAGSGVLKVLEGKYLTIFGLNFVLHLAVLSTAIIFKERFKTPPPREFKLESTNETGAN